MVDQVRLLIIDDNEDDRLLYTRLLSKAADVDYAIEEAEDGESGSTLLERHLPDCVLLDYSLPGRNGVEVLKRIRAKHPFVPVLMLTGQGNETVAVTAMQLGAQNYISKSAIDAEQLHRAVQIAIAHCAMQQRLHEQRLSLEIFTRALAHDLKEPVRTIRSFLSILADSESLTDQGRHHFGFVESAAERMGALINAVYDYTRLDMSAQQLGIEACDAATLLSEARADLDELIAEREAFVSADALPQVSANRARLRQVFQNLISNAIRHCPAGAMIHVTAEERGQHYLFSVADNGPGVELELRDKIFEPFTRHSREGAKGLGMGLAICKRIVESHGGRIWCDASATGGAAFTFTLPKTPVNTKPEPASAPLASAMQMGDPSDLATILVVDDNDAAIELARIMLLESSKLRCRLITASTGEEALATLRSCREHGPQIDLMLLDINMPRMDGFQVLDELRRSHDPPKPPVVMCSTSGYDKDIERARRLGATGYLEKPPNLRALMPFLTSLPGLQLTQCDEGYPLHRVA